MPDKILSRGAASNPPNRFETVWYVSENEPAQEDDPAPGTHFLRDSSRSLITYNDSPDVGFNASINPYRGCEHGCIYCYARPTHEYLGFSAGLDFETKILVKEDAPALLRQELASPRWKPQVVAISGVTDPYQPVERRLKLTRQCLEILVEFRNPVVIVTKNHLVTRDADLLEELAGLEAAAVFLSVTTLDGRLSQVMEPRASHPARRLAAIEKLARAKVPVGVLVAPVIPGFTDHEVPSIIAACAEAGARYAGYVLLRLPYAVSPLFEEWLTRHFPERKEKVLRRIRSMRGGKLYDPHFFSRMKGEGVFAKQIASLFSLACQRGGLKGRTPKLSISSFRRPTDRQRLLFP
ncbi:MAG: radical SAM protein [Acidobacteria bacterium]|nr:MAG: radical SAM protein [Acidobacteriota bacterium]